MRFRSTLPLVAVGLVLSTAAIAQNAPDRAAPRLPPFAGDQAQTLPGVSPPVLTPTQSSRIRAFNAGPDGQVQSLYLQNGSVVNVPPDLGRQLSTHAYKGVRVQVSGSETTIHGQRIILANQITLNSQTYSSRLQRGPDERAGIGPNGPRAALAGGAPGRMPPPPAQARLLGPGPELGPQPSAPQSGPYAQRGTGTQAPPPPPPSQGAPMGGPQGGSGQQDAPPPSTLPPTPSGAPGQPGPQAFRSPGANHRAPAAEPSL